MTHDATRRNDRDAVRAWLAAAVVLVGVGVVGAIYVHNSRVEDPTPFLATLAPAETAVVGSPIRVAEVTPRTIDPYVGYGTWVDVFDYDPAYNPPTVTAKDLPEMAELGVRTVYLQAARLDERTPDGLVDPWLLTEFVLGARAEGLGVVAWYLPRFGDGPEDLERLQAISEFQVMGHRFDGMAVDIEWIGDDIDDETRTARLLALSEGLRDSVGEDPLGAIVPPPVQIEVINPAFWPGFPWAELGELYDVWLPMSYWSFRTDASGYADGYTYHEESTRRLRTNVGDPNVPVHGIGGIGGVDGIDDPVDPPEPLASIDEIERFVDALADTESIGGSIYDWNTLEPPVRQRLAELMAP